LAQASSIISSFHDLGCLHRAEEKTLHTSFFVLCSILFERAS